MTLRRAALAISFFSIALLPIGPGCGGKVGGTLGSDSGSGGSNEDVTSSGSTSSSGFVGSSGSGASSGSGSSSGGFGSSSSGGSGGSSTGSGSGVVDAGAPSCMNPASMVPSSEIPGYGSVIGVTQATGACSGSDISGFIAACDSSSATSAACDAWLQSATLQCLHCLGMLPDGGALDLSGGVWFDWQYNFIGANAPGCDALVDGNDNCAVPYNAAVQCLIAAGCGTCVTQTEYQSCEQQVFNVGGACQGYLQPAQMACMSDFAADGGALNNGPCSSDRQILSVICGNGSGDGG